MNLSVHLPIFAPKVVNNRISNENLNNTNFKSSLQLRQLNRDMVSFRGMKGTTKEAGELADIVRKDVADKVLAKMEKPHKKLNELLEAEFGDLTTEKNKYKKKVITLIGRVKGAFSARLKTGSRKWTSEKDMLQYMNDMSGFCFILEDKRAFTEVMNRFIKLIKSGTIRIPRAEEINADDIEGYPVEYHVLPSVYKRGKVVEDNNSLPFQKLQELKQTLIDVYHPSSAMSVTMDSSVGYSGLHVIVKNFNGAFSEIKFLTRAIADVQRIENLIYKIKSGKEIDPHYKDYMEPVLIDLKKPPKYAPEEEQKKYKELAEAMRLYTIEVYKDALRHPFKKDAQMPHPKDPKIAKYDFNKLKMLMDACDSMK